MCPGELVLPGPTVDQRFNVQDSHGPTLALQRTLPPRERWEPRRMDLFVSGSRQKDGTKTPGCFEKTTTKKGIRDFRICRFFLAWCGKKKAIA